MANLRLDLPSVCILVTERVNGNVRVSLLDRGKPNRPLLELTPEQADKFAGDLLATVTEIIAVRREAERANPG